MDILKTHEHRLVFRIDNYAPKEYMDRWKDFKLKCESGESGLSTPGPNKYILEKMKEYFDRYSMNFPYLQDASQEVAREYRAECTPDIYVFNSDRKLAYHGRIDDNWQDESAVTQNELAEALETILNGAEFVEQQPTIGCSIKWRD